MSPSSDGLVMVLPTRPSSRIGRKLGHYWILELIGSGGMGEVYLAEDKHLNRRVALKVLPPATLPDKAARLQFRREASLCCRVNHPNIATVYEFNSDEGIDYLAMEYVAGNCLSEEITVRPHSEQEVVELAIQLAEALVAAHSQGLVHNDLKPANIRITPEGRAKILDFGLARLAPVVSRSAETAPIDSGEPLSGTLPYMAPEQLQGQAPDARSDIYSLGVILYELITGRLPFWRAGTAALIANILNVTPRALRELTAGVSPELERIVLRCLEKSPKARYQDASDLLLDLRRLQPSKRAMRLRRPWQKRLIALAALVAICLGAGLFAVMGRSYSSFTSRPALAFVARNFVLVSDFENQTGNPAFDKSLSTAFSIALEQSGYANVYPRQRMTEALKRMKRPVVDHIDEALAQEIAAREGIKVIVLPSIIGMGQSYQVRATIRDVASGINVKHEVVQVNGKITIFDAVDTLSAAIRHDLGESLQAIAQRKPLISVTTRSLEALRQYSIATEKAQALSWDEARVYFENALHIDPAFTAAQASLGMLHVEHAANNLPHFDAETGKRLLNEAVKHVDELTDREKYSILAFHARAVEHDAGKAIGYLKTLIALYPDDSDYHVKLGRVYGEIGRLPDALSEYQEAVRIEPKSVLAYGNVAATFLYYMGNIAAAVPVLQKMLELDPANELAHNALGWSYLAKNELPQAQAAFEEAIADNPQGTLARFRLAHTYRLQGQYQQAIKALQQIQKVDPSDPSVFYDMGVIYDSMGDRSKARGAFARYRDELQTRWKKIPREPGAQMDLAAAFARLGEARRARELLRDAMARGPQYHMEAACVLSLLGEKKGAVRQLELAIDNGYSDVIWLKVHPDLLPLHGYDGYEQLMSKVITI